MDWWKILKRRRGLFKDFFWLFLAPFVPFLYLQFWCLFATRQVAESGSMPKVEKRRSAVETYAGKTTPHKEFAPAAVTSTSNTPPPSPGAEQRAQKEWRERQAALQARIEVAHAEVMAALDQLKQLKSTAADDDGSDAQAAAEAESLLAYRELSHFGVENVFNTVEQAGVFADSSSEDSDEESESEKSTEY